MSNPSRHDPTSPDTPLADAAADSTTVRERADSTLREPTGNTAREPDAATTDDETDLEFPTRSMSSDRRNSARALTALPPGTRIGRYIIAEKLGAGGMGVVYQAYDPQLERRVALKLLRPHHSSDERLQLARARLLREAQALAQLSHPNVIKIYDVGTFAKGVFLAIELADGPTLKQWLASQRRSRREILAVMSAAGRGLAAAHRAGLVHRDFKPANVILGDDGRVRVLDFGLARVANSSLSMSHESVFAGHAPTRPGDEQRESEEIASVSHIGHHDAHTPDHHGSDDQPRAFDDRRAADRNRDRHPLSPRGPLTSFGDILGTPAYMSPEQHLGDEVDARSDQFSFCVTLFRAVYGCQPFTGRDLPSLRAQVLSGKVQTPPDHRKLPAWLSALLMRGLATERDDRYPSMDALLTDLERGPKRRRRWLAAVLIAPLALTLALALALTSVRQPERCQDSEARLSKIWNLQVRQQLRTAFVATGRSHALATHRQVSESLDAYGHDWIATSARVCEAAYDRGSLPEAELDVRMLCLTRRLGRLRATIDVLTQAADGEVVDRAWNAVRNLPSAHSCGDDDALSRAPKLPAHPGQYAATQALDAKLDEFDALYELGRSQRALAAARALIAPADALDYPPLQARAHYSLALALELAGADAERALEELRLAAQLAGSAEDDQLLAQIWIRTMWITGATLDRPSEALALRPAAETALARMSDHADVSSDQLTALRAEILGRVAHILSKASSYRSGERRDEALQAMAQALSLAESLHGTDDPALIPYLEWQGSLYFNIGDYQTAHRVYLRLSELIEAHYGADHIFLSAPLIGIGTSLIELGPYDVGLEYFERAVALEESNRGPDTIHILRPLLDVGVAAYRLSHYRDAVAALRRSLALAQKYHQPSHWLVALQRRYLGVAVREHGQYDEAQAIFERLIASYDAAGKNPDSMYARTHAELALIASAQGDTERAMRLARRGAEIFEHTLGRDHRFAAPVYRNLGTVLLRHGDPEQAAEWLEYAHQLRLARVAPDHPAIALYLASLAELDSVRGDHDSACAKLEQARSIRAAYGFESDAILAQLTHELAMCEQARGKLDGARTGLEAARAMWRSTTVDPAWPARTKLALAEVLTAQEREPKRAQALVEAALQGLAGLGPRVAAERAQAQAWLSQHARAP